MNRSRNALPIVLLLTWAALAAGCSSTKLETGYQPRPLGASDLERKAFYSAKYTRAAAMAEQERGRDAEFRARRPDYRPGL